MSSAYHNGYDLRKIDIQWRLFKGDTECFPGLFYATESACIMVIDGAPKDPEGAKKYWASKIAFCQRFHK